jgi:hypothetical protein
LGIASKLALTTSAVSGVPSLKVTPGRRWKVNDRASEPTFQLCASQGTIFPVEGSWSVSESTSCRTE